MSRPHLIGGAIGLLIALVFHFVPASREVVAGVLRRPYLLLLVPVALALFFLPRYRRSARLNEEGLGLLAQGHVFAALEKFTAARSLAKSPVIPTFNIGLCRLYLWQLDEAERELATLHAREDLLPQFRGVLLPRFALVAALDGRFRDALVRLDEVKALQSGAAEEALLAEAVLACRNKDWARARELLEREALRSLQDTLPLRGLRDALLAWSVEQLTGERRRVEALAVFKEASPDKLQAAWPELADFLLAGAQRQEGSGDGSRGG
jgi:hypothetical protein